MGFQQMTPWYDDFLGNRSLTSAQSEAGSGWTGLIVKTGGSPTIATATGSTSGTMFLTTDNTSEVQKVLLYDGDVLSLSPAQIEEVTINVSLAGQTSATTAYCGVAVANNSTASSIAGFAWLKIVNSLIYCETNNGTTTTSVSSGLSIPSGLTLLKVNFAYGLTDVRFYAQNSAGQITRLCGSTKYDMSLLTGSVQKFCRVEKTSGTAVPILGIDAYGVSYKH